MNLKRRKKLNDIKKVIVSYFEEEATTIVIQGTFITCTFG
jgi:hypothetical protein